MNRYLQNLEINSNPKKINYRDLMIFIVPILIFSLYLFIYNPGILTSESFSQFHQIATGEFTNSFPFFHTFIEMIFLNIFGTPLSIAILQIFVFSAIWTAICKYHRDDGSESNNAFVLQFIVTLIICLIPINAVYSITLWKEILFSYSILFLTFLINVLVDRSGEMDLKFAIILALTIAVTSQLSTIGIYIGIITLIAILGYMFLKNKKNTKTFKILPILTIVFILLIGSLSFAFTLEDAPANNSGGAPIVWSVLRGDDWNGQAYYITKDGAQLKEAQDKYYAGNNITPTADYEKLTSPHQGEGRYNQISSYAVYFKDHTLTDTLFYSPALYMYLAIILLIAIQLITKSKDMYLIYVPNIINIIGVFLTCSLNENRFLYPNILIVYLLIIIFISIYFRGDLKSLPVTLNAQKRKESNIQKTSHENIYEPDRKQDSFANIDKEIQEPTQDLIYDENDIDNILEKIELDQSEEENHKTKKNNEYDSDLINEAKPDSTQEANHDKPQEESEFDSDLIEQILKEMEMEKQNKE